MVAGEFLPILAPPVDLDDGVVRNEQPARISAKSTLKRAIFRYDTYAPIYLLNFILFKATTFLFFALSSSVKPASAPLALPLRFFRRGS